MENAWEVAVAAAVAAVGEVGEVGEVAVAGRWGMQEVGAEIAQRAAAPSRHQHPAYTGRHLDR